jgi:hypothetical protein
MLDVAYLVHLERSRDGLDQHSTTDGSTAHANVVLSKIEDVIPQPCLKMRLHLGQVEVWTESTLDKLMCVVEEVQAEVKETTRDGLAVNGEVLLLEVPSAGTGNECGKCAVGAELVLLLTLLEVDLAANGVVEVSLAIDHVVPCWRAGVWLLLDLCPLEKRPCMLTLEISHVCPDIGVECVDDHLAVCRSCDLYSAVDETGGWWCSLPCWVLADVLGLGEEIEEVALVELSLTQHSPLQKLLSAVVECAVEKSKEDSSIFAEDVTVGVVQLAEDVNLAENGISAGCHCDNVSNWDLCIMQLRMGSRYRRCELG